MDPTAVAPVVAQDDPFKLVEQILAAAQAKNWLLLVPVACLLAVYLVRRFLGPKVPWLQTDRGGALLNLLSAVFAAVVSAALVPGPHTVVSVIGTIVTVLLGNQLLFAYLNKLLSPTGKDAAQTVAATVAVATANAAASPTAAAASINDAAAKMANDLK